MFPEDVKVRFQKIVALEMTEMDQALSRAFTATISGAAAHGALHSGRTLLSLKTDAVNSLKARSHFILGQLLRCLSAYSTPLNAETLSKASALLREAIRSQINSVQSKLFAHSVFQTEPDKEKQQIQDDYCEEGLRQIEKQDVELSITAAASSSQSSNTKPTFNFNGPIGVVQTGIASQATVSQQFNADVKNQVGQALQNLLVQLKLPENASMAQRAELQEIVVEAKNEVQKSNPNSLKIGSSLRTIAETIKFVGSLGPAYQAIKPLLSYFGYHLP